MHLQTAMNCGRLLLVHLIMRVLVLRRMDHHVHGILGEFVACGHLAGFIVVWRIHTHFKIRRDSERSDLAKPIVMVMMLMVAATAAFLLIARGQLEATTALNFAARPAVRRLAAQNVPLGGLLRDHLVQRTRVIIEVVEH